MANYPLQEIPVFNQFDEFGLLVGLGHWSDDGLDLQYVRYPGESNKQLRDRTVLTSAYKGNATVQGMINNISRDLSIGTGLVTPRYNVNTKNIFYLSQKPYTDPSGIQVYIYNSGILSSSGTLLTANEVTPQVRASGYSTATSGWIVWNLPDFDASTIPEGLPGSRSWYNNYDPLVDNVGTYASGIHYGEYTQILEFIGDSIPKTGERIRVDYNIENGIDLYGQVIINKRTDFSNPDDIKDTTFIGSRSEFPLTSNDYKQFVSGHISIFTLDQLSMPSISGVFYDSLGKPTKKLIDIANIVNDEYPLYWDSFNYDVGRWDQLDMASVGSIPSFHDESIVPLSGLPIKGGSKYGVDLDCVGLTSIGDNARSAWYPTLVPGEFYIGNEKFYLYGNQQYQKPKMYDIGNGIYSGNLAEQWAVGNVGTNEALMDVVFGNNQFVAVGVSGGVYVSYDTINWNKTFTAPSYHRFDAITYANNIYVAVGTSSFIMTSPDATGWTLRTSSGTPCDLEDVSFQNNRFIIVGDFGKILTSPDSITWTDQSLPTTTDHLYSVTYGQGQDVVGGSNLNYSSGVLYNSINGINWTKNSFANAHRFKGIAYGNDTFVAAGRSGVINMSTDITQGWSFVGQPTTALQTWVNFSAGRFTIVGYAGTILTSEDGSHWKNQNSNIDTLDIEYVDYGMGTYVAVGQRGLVLTNKYPSETSLPYRLGTVSAYSSGLFYSDTLPNNPYFKRLHDFSNPISGVYYRSPYVSYTSKDYDLTKMQFDGNNFYYDYDSQIIIASGINPTGFIVVWDHSSVYTSGVQVIYSGGYGFTPCDFNPLSDPFDKILYLN